MKTKALKGLKLFLLCMVVVGFLGMGSISAELINEPVTIDVDDPEAFLVRKAGDGGNMFLVNTSETKYSSFKIDNSWNAFHFVKQNPEFNTLRFTNYAGGSSQPADIVLETAKGTAASPSSVGVGSGIGGFRLKARGSSNWPIVGEMKWVVQSISGNNIGSYVHIDTSTSGGVNTERLRIDQNGNVGIGITNPSSKLHVAGNVTVSNGRLDFIDGDGPNQHDNVYIGYQTGDSIIDQGYALTFVGAWAGANNTTGGPNTFVGYNSGWANNTGHHNTFLGADAGSWNCADQSQTLQGGILIHTCVDGDFKGSYNTFLGKSAGFGNETGSYNVYVGRAAGDENTDGNKNVIVGDEAGRFNTGSGNVFIGRQAGMNATGNNQLYIDNTSTNSPLIWGDFAANHVRINGTIDWTSDGSLKKDIKPIESPLNKILSIEGVSYAWKTEEYKGKWLSEGKHYGVIGQQVEKVLPAIVKEGPNGYKGVAYTEIIPVLIEAVKEQQKIIEKQQKEIEEQQKAMEVLKSKVQRLETKDLIAKIQ